jgi:hypothetical protein
VLLLEHQLFTRELTPAGAFTSSEAESGRTNLANGLDALFDNMRKEDESLKDSQEEDDD